MTWNWTAEPKDCVYMDFETQSLSDIKKDGGRKYIADKSTRIICCGFLTEERKTLWITDAVIPDIKSIDDWEIHRGSMPPDWVFTSKKTLCAHNTDFDKGIWDRFVQVDMPWTDAMPMCRSAGLPGSLDKACSVLFGQHKHPGKELLNVVCKAKPNGIGYKYANITTNAWVMFLQYCCWDVQLLSKLHGFVLQYAEPDALDVHQKINERGIPVNKQLAAKLIMLQEELKIEKADEFAELTDLTADDARSTVKVKDWLLRIGIKLPTKNGKVTLERKELNRLFKEPDAFCDGPNDELSAAVDALKARVEIVRATAGKALTIIKVSDNDSRVRGQHVYHGAHTGRFSGRQMQPHNFPKGCPELSLEPSMDLTLDDLKQEATRITSLRKSKSQNTQDVTCSDIISSMLRQIISSNYLCVCDFASIEARGVAWICSENSALQEFWKWDADPYLPLASRIFGRPITKKDELERWVAKQAILGCGYSMSYRKFLLYCAANGVDLESVNVNAEQVVKLYREAHPNIVKGWRLLHDAAHAAVEGSPSPSRVCKCNLYMENRNLHMQLPSGRSIVYRNARIEPDIPAYAKLFGYDAKPIPTLMFDHPHGYTGKTYGGRLMENCVQAVCRDLLVDALVRVERSGLNPVMHVHDEIITESQDLDSLCKIMSTPPSWASDFPVKVEGFICSRYTKSPPKDVLKCESLNGETR